MANMKEERRGWGRGSTTQPAVRPAIRLGAGLGLAVLIGALVVGTAQAFSPAEIYRNASSSVVLIFGFDEGGRGSSGTGSVISRDGLVLTNDHVIANGDTGRLFPNLVVYFKPKPISGDNRKDLTEPHLVEVIARDSELDLALLRVKEPPPGLRPIEIGNSEEVDIGEPVAAIGHPGGGGLWTLTTGTVSSKRKDQLRDIFQTDTAINPGNSGGPLLDEHARLVGVNTFVRRVNEQGLPLEGLNYSLRSAAALAWVNQQGVLRVAAISRSTADDLRTAPAPAPVPPRTAEPETTEDPEPPRDDPPTSPSGPAPEARAPEPPQPSAPRSLPRSAPEPRAFEGPDGETMYGVPNPQSDLDETLLHAREGYRKLIERADESVREMERLLDDYDDF